MAGARISPARRLGGISFMLSGMLYLIKSILDLIVGDPPSTGPEILEWRSSHELALACTSEVLFAAAVLLVPAVIGSTAVWMEPTGLGWDSAAGYSRRSFQPSSKC